MAYVVSYQRRESSFIANNGVISGSRGVPGREINRPVFFEIFLKPAEKSDYGILIKISDTSKSLKSHNYGIPDSRSR